MVFTAVESVFFISLNSDRISKSLIWPSLSDVIGGTTDISLLHDKFSAKKQIFLLYLASFSPRPLSPSTLCFEGRGLLILSVVSFFWRQRAEETYNHRLTASCRLSKPGGDD